MNADAFRHFYQYHFSENRKLWDGYISELTPEHFLCFDEYSKGSIRNQVAHLMNVDDAWFKGLQGNHDETSLETEEIDDRIPLRAC